MSTPAKHRLVYLDLCKIIAIFLVLSGHSIQYCGKGEPFDNPIWALIYSFHMPLFMILSGFFFQSSLNLSLKDIVMKKFSQLLLPTIVFFCLLNIPLWLVTSPPPLDFSIAKCNSLCSDFIGWFWFLKCLFVCYIIVFLSLNILKNDILAFFLTTLIVISGNWFNLWYIDFMLPFFWSGYFIRKHQDFFSVHSKTILLSAFITSAVLLLFWNGRLTVYCMPVKVFTADYDFDIHNIIVCAYRFFIGLSCSIFIIECCRYVSNTIITKELPASFYDIGKNTLGIYIIQTYTLELLLQRVNMQLDAPYAYALALPIAIAELFVCNVLVGKMRRNKTTHRFLLGGK